jgi:adenylosuccinate synthase
MLVPREQFSPGFPAHDQSFKFNREGQLALFPDLDGRAVVCTTPHQTPFGAQHVSIFGLKTGDEGKGRAVLEIAALLRFLSDDPSAVAAVVKANGGANSGHTAAGVKLNLIPSGIADPSIEHLCLCRGVVADPIKLCWEIKALQSNGLDPSPRLRLDNRLMLSHVGHRLLDLAAEIGTPRGSTGRGISPTYGDETTQHQIFFEDLLGSHEVFAQKLTSRLVSMTARIRHEFKLDTNQWNELFDKLTAAELKAHRKFIDLGVFAESDFDFSRFRSGRSAFQLHTDVIVDAYWQAGQKLRDLVTNVSELSLALARQGRHVLYEHGQGVLLDKRLGYSPSVTASHTTAAEIFHSNSLPINAAVHAIGVMKAYDTKVGKHLFLSQIEAEHPLAQILGKIEFGTTTGRSRMVGWFDAVEAGWALRHAGAHELIINKLDVLTLGGDWQGPLKVCVAYQDAAGNRHFTLPTNDATRAAMTPIYEETPGWTEDISAVRSWDALPLNAQIYVAKLYAASLNAWAGGAEIDAELPPLRFIGVGPDPGQIISDVPRPHLLLRLAR